LFKKAVWTTIKIIHGLKPG